MTEVVFLGAFLFQRAAGLPHQLDSPAARRQWETSFAREVADGVTREPQQLLRRLAAAGAGGAGGVVGGSHLEAEVAELLPDSMLQDVAYRGGHMPRVLRATRLPTVEAVSLLASNQATGGDRGQQLLLELLGALQPQSPLQLLQHLPALVAWARLVQTQLGYRISRREAQELSVQEVLRRFQGTEELAAALPGFLGAWGACRHMVDGYRCTAFTGGVPPLTHDSCFSLCCLGSQDDGLYLRAMVEELAALQSGWLRKCADLQVGGSGGNIFSRDISYSWEFDLIKHQNGIYL